MSVADDIEYRWRIFSEAMTIVDEKFEDGRTYALDAISKATEIMDSIQEIATELNAIDVDATMENLTPPTIPDFTETKPTAPDLTTNFPTAPADTDLQGDIETKLRSMVAGTEAIPQSIQDAILAKDSERDAQILQDTLDSISDEWSKRGFSLPNAMLNSSLSQAIIDHGNKRTDKSRDILIRNWELTDQNIRFAIDKGIMFLLQRVQIYQAEVSAESTRIDALVRKYLGEVTVYKSQADVHLALADVDIKRFDSELRYELARAELTLKNADIDIKNFEVMYNLRLEAMKGIGGINSQIVAGALSSVSASAQISASNAANYTYSTNPSY